MPNRKSWEFDCPQFVDFAAGLGKDSPTYDVKWFGNSKAQLAEMELQDDRANKQLGPKMATPKLRPDRAMRNSPFVNTLRPTDTDDDKLAALGQLPPRLSKSDGFLSKKVIENLRSPELLLPRRKIFGPGRKRSLSESCIKTKKKITPGTPMCLKRTLHKGKSKKFKSTEEMELEKITELQNELSRHLRLNEVNMKRLKRRQPPYLMHNLINKKVEPLAVHPISGPSLVKGCKNPATNLNGQRQTRKSRFQEERSEGLSQAQNTKDHVQELKLKSKRLQAILNPPPKATPVLSNALRVVNTVDGRRSILHKPIPLLKYKAHSGLTFNPNQSKKTVPCPFSFDSSCSTSFQNASITMKANGSVSKADLSCYRTPDIARNKENILPSVQLYPDRNFTRKCVKK